MNFEQNEEQEKALVEFVQNDSVIIIQKHCRRVLALNIFAARRIELGLHLRVSVHLCSYLYNSIHASIFVLILLYSLCQLLMFLERFAVDGCMFSFLKSINDDYARYETTLTSTIER